MGAHSLTKNAGLEKLVQKQMRNWELAKSQRPEAVVIKRPAVEPFLAISRPVGALSENETGLVAALGEELGWPVFDKQILQAMAENDSVREQLYKSMDERDLSWFEETLRGLMSGPVKKNDYFSRLTETILTTARQSKAVFLGRAADLILPQGIGFRVRLTSSRKNCAKRHAADQQIDIAQAVEEVERVQAERDDFAYRYFNVPKDDQTRYDLVVNVDRFLEHEVRKVILLGMQLRGIIN